MDYFVEAEKVLYSVHELTDAIKNLEIREKQIIRRNGPKDVKGLDTSAVYISTSMAADSMQDLCDLAEVRRQIVETRETIKLIKQVVGQMSESHQNIIDLWYYKKLRKEDIMRELFASSPKVIYNIRNEAVCKFAARYYGAVALNCKP